jgi:hypothetical protein
VKKRYLQLFQKPEEEMFRSVFDVFVILLLYKVYVGVPLVKWTAEPKFAEYKGIVS